MKITKLTNYPYYKDGHFINRVRRKVLLNTDEPKNRPRSIADRIEEALEYLDRAEKRFDNLLHRICDIISHN